MTSILSLPASKRPNGLVFYVGPSAIDGQPIVGIMTGINKTSNNPKTDKMIQTWILRLDVNPVVALKTGEDVSICGDCPHRPQGENGSQRTCYVNPMGPNSIYKSFVAGKYPVIDYDILPEVLNWRADQHEHKIRFGSYGDPAAIPFDVWAKLLTYFADNTGYTHRWRNISDDRFKSIVMASCDNLMDYVEASEQGWSTFRVTTDSSDRQRGQIACGASEEMGYKTTCRQCTLCSGTDDSRPEGKEQKHVVIQVHGNGKKYFAA